MASANSPTALFTHGRVATQPLRFFSLALYVAVLCVELAHWALGWCSRDYQLGWLLPVLIILGIFLAMEWGEQRFFSQKPALGIAITVLVIRILLTEAAGSYGCSGFHSFFGFIPPLLAYLYIGWRAAFITAGVNFVLYVNWVFDFPGFDMDLLQADNVVVEIFIFLVGLVLVLVLGRVLVLEERNRQRAESLVVELEQSQRQIAELAAVDERNRIARDIHDSVGHHLTAVNIQLEKAMAFREIDAAEADQALRDAKRSAQSALHDVRDSVSALRDPDREYELGTALRELVDGFGRIPVTLTTSGSEAPFAKSTLLALYRVAQEGLTNIAKHADATSAQLTVALHPDHATLELSDNGSGMDLSQLEAKAARGDAHFGLTGLRERLETVGGTLTISSKLQQGTTLHVRVPARGLT